METVEPRILAHRIASLIERSKINVTTEDSAHTAVFDALVRDGLPAEIEVALSAKDRIDVMVCSVGIEVKVMGSRRDIYRQLYRYAELDQVHALVLATGVAWPAAVREVNGKPLFVASFHKGWL